MFATYGGTFENVDGAGLMALFVIGMVIAAVLVYIAIAYLVSKLFLRNNPDKSRKKLIKTMIIVTIVLITPNYVILPIARNLSYRAERNEFEARQKEWRDCYNRSIPEGWKRKNSLDLNKEAAEACQHLSPYRSD